MEAEELNELLSLSQDQFRMKLIALSGDYKFDKFKEVLDVGHPEFNLNEKNDIFQECCRAEQTQFIQYLLAKKKMTNLYYLQKGIMHLSDRKNPLIVEVLNYYLELSHDPELTKQFLNKLFLNACECSDLNLVEFLLCSDKLNIDIHTEEDKGFVLACNSPANLELIKFLSSSPKIQEHANINANDSIGLRELFLTSKGLSNLPIIQYLLFSPELKVHANIESVNYDCLKAVSYKRNEELMNYLIFDYQLPLTVNLQFELETDPSLTIVKKKFSLRELNKNLEENLEMSVVSKKVKI